MPACNISCFLYARPLITFIKSPSLLSSHPSGNSNGFSSSLISGSGFCFLIFPCFTSSAFSAAIRFNNSDAGSSFGSCGTSLPRTASSRISSRSFLMPYRSILPLLPRPAVERVCSAEDQISIWSVISFSTVISSPPCCPPVRHREYRAAGYEAR